LAIQRLGRDALLADHDRRRSGIDGGACAEEQSGAPQASPVGSFVNTIDVVDLDATVRVVTDNGGTVALPKHAVPTVGWLGLPHRPRWEQAHAGRPRRDLR